MKAMYVMLQAERWNGEPQKNFYHPNHNMSPQPAKQVLKMTSKAQVALEEHQEKDAKCKNDGSNKEAASKQAHVAPKMHDSNTNTKDIESSWGSTTSSSKRATIEDIPDEDDPLNDGKSMQSPSIELVMDPEDELDKL